MRTKFSVQEQILHLKINHNIEFRLISEIEAETYLTDKNYFFKLKAYAGVFEGLESPVDFFYLIELSKLDMYLRRTILLMTLNLEHSLRCLLVKFSTLNAKDDGYLVVRRFLTYYDGKFDKSLNWYRPNYKVMVERDVKSYSSLFDLDPITGDLQEELPVWKLVEVLSFQPLIAFYNFYRKTYPNSLPKLDHFYGFSVKKLRNSAAHSNCLLHNLKPSCDIIGYNKFKVDNSLSTFLHNKLLPKVRNMDIDITFEELDFISIPLIHDLTALIFMYNELVKSNEIKYYDFQSLKNFVDKRALRYKEFFENVATLSGSLKFISKIIDFVQSP